MKHIEPQQTPLFDDLEEPEKLTENPFCTSRLGDIAEFYAVLKRIPERYRQLLFLHSRYASASQRVGQKCASGLGHIDALGRLGTIPCCLP